ncbi:prephenate dehydrogenase [Natronosalvus halobius]|uniref:prephenate dehydrogenase n=1 Tax=Natronosalvus halobius TaxID=2953746 RepID=UPI0020A0466F|nr:prephenate dehydrogenase [Natronosalvus halobius]USZ73260.1 prephenate dehydrogenase [Natronosalvus halobius]
MEVLIVGAGAMGTWFGEAIADDPSVDAMVAFADVDEDAAERAAETVAGTTADLDGATTYDAVCVAVPMGRVEASIEQHAKRAERAILDVTGVMATPLEAMAAHADDLERASLHPLFAPERAPGSIATVRAREGPVTDSLLSALESAGNRLVETTPEEHDRAMGSVQAAAHAAILSFALAAERVPEGFQTPIYDDIERLATYVTGGSPHVYADIQRTFDGADAVAEAARAIADADDEAFEALYDEATERWSARERLDDGETDVQDDGETIDQDGVESVNGGDCE